MIEITSSPVFEEAFQNLRKITETNLRLQQEMFSQWTMLWPGMPVPQSALLDRMKQFRMRWAEMISELAHDHHQVVDRQYKSTLEALDAALQLNEATSPEELRRKTEQYCRKSIDTLREVSETQIREFQEMASKVTRLITQEARATEQAAERSAEQIAERVAG